MRFFLFYLPLLTLGNTIVPEFLVTTGGQVLSAKRTVTGACNSEGQTVIVWLDHRDGELHYPNTEWPQVFVQSLDAIGVPQGENFHLETGNEFSWFPAASSAALFDDGMALIAAICENQSTPSDRYRNTVIRLWDMAQGFETKPLAEFEIDVKMPVLVPYDNNHCLAVQNTPSEPNYTNDIEFQRFTRTGELLEEKVFVDSGEVQNVIADKSGNFVICYTQNGGPSYYRRFDSYGKPKGERVVIDSTAAIATMAGNPTGNLFCCWLYNDEDWNTFIYSQRFSASDEPIGSPQILYQATIYEQPMEIKIVEGPQDGFLLLYTVGDYNNPETQDTLYALFLNANGAPQGNAFAVNEPCEDAALLNSFWAGAEDDRYNVAWIEDEDINLKQSKVYTRKVLPSGAVSTIYRVCDDEPGYHPSWNEPVLTPQGDFFVHWEGGYPKAEYLKRYAQQGEPLGSVWSLDEAKCPALAFGLDGKLYFSYTTTGVDSTHTVWVQRFNEAGLPDGPAWEVGHAEEKCRGSAVAVGKDGNGLAMWIEKDPASPVTDAFLCGQFFSASGQKTGEPFRTQSYYNRGCLRAIAFEDGGYAVGWSVFNEGDYYCYLFDQEGNLVGNPFRLDEGNSTQEGKSMATNGKDRFVAVWLDLRLDIIYSQAFDREGGKVGDQYEIRLPSKVNSVEPFEGLYLEGYWPSVSMAPDGRFIVAWQEPDASDNLNLWAQAFSRDGVPISRPHQVNGPDQWPYSFQISGWRGVSCTNDRILFTWLENRSHRGWEVMAKVTDWDEFPGINDEPLVGVTPIKLEAGLNRLSWEVPGEATLTIYNSAGQRMESIRVKGSGEITLDRSMPAGVYFARLESAGFEVVKKVVILR